MVKILLIGKSGRLDCIADAVKKSLHFNKLYILSEVCNPGILDKSEHIEIGITDDVDCVKKYARRVKPDFVIIGPEEPLATGVTDMLIEELGIPCVGPKKLPAQIECSKSFTRELMSKYNIPGNPEYRIFQTTDGLEFFLRKIVKFVIKPDGLTGGKGVKVYGEHLFSVEEALQYCKSLFGLGHKAVVVEEKLVGEEFSLQSFCDGRHVVDTPPVQDHKRAFEADNGPNTGGMGSYSCENHDLPFVSKDYIQVASKINLAVSEALRNELDEEFKGILYGGFIVTKDGLKVLEYNARFGDPEVMNVLPLLQTDFVDVCEAVINGTLDKLSVVFDNKATVCKYVVPKGYPTSSVKDVRINEKHLPKSTDKLKIYYAAINKKEDGFYLTGSRAFAFLGIGDNVAEAEQIAEDAIKQIKGPIYYRKDIGTVDLIQKRIDHMKEIMNDKKCAA